METYCYPYQQRKKDEKIQLEKKLGEKRTSLLSLSSWYRETIKVLVANSKNLAESCKSVIINLYDAPDMSEDVKNRINEYNEAVKSFHRLKDNSIRIIRLLIKDNIDRHFGGNSKDVLFSKVKSFQDACQVLIEPILFKQKISSSWLKDWNKSWFITLESQSRDYTDFDVFLKDLNDMVHNDKDLAFFWQSRDSLGEDTDNLKPRIRLAQQMIDSQLKNIENQLGKKSTSEPK